MRDPEKFGRHIADTVGEGPTDAQLERQRQRLVRHVSATSPKPQRRLWWGMGVGFATGAAALAVALWVTMPTASIRPKYWVGSQAATASTETTWSTAVGQELPIRFDDKTEVVAETASKVALSYVSRALVRVKVSQGSVRARVTPHQQTTWEFLAGDFKVRVVGTVLRVGYVAASATTTVSVESGRVLVTGPGLPAKGKAVGPGEAMSLSAQPALPQVAPPPEELMAPATPEPRRVPVAQPRPPTWQEHVERAEYREAWALVQRKGLKVLAAQSSPAELETLADIARLVGAAREARQVLNALAKRFPKHASAKLVPFLLGRLAQEVEHDEQAAVREFERYLAAEPRGALAEEAHGRLLVALAHLKNYARARELAARYLERYPQGVYTTVAKELVAQP